MPCFSVSPTATILRSGRCPCQNAGDSRPTAREWAEQLGIRLRSIYCCPIRAQRLKGRPGFVQTLHYPSDLESIARRISYAARTAIEESGTNTLYLIFGFLEWYESESSSEAHLAPLLVVPVTIARGKADPASGTTAYEIAYSGEEIEPNLCLREKLTRDFGLDLPDFSEDDTPDTYFSKFQGILKAKVRWRLRCQITLGLLYFGKLRMYRDLDPRVWPANSSGLLQHPLIKDLFEGTKRTDRNFSEEYAIDSPALSKQIPPVILDADSSQLSALIDALQGKNLVVQGPPGTGKSQTISNLIAIALAEGKTVLFVSEKLAALEVVRRRLDVAGLGIFCLELHSHKTEKRKLLDDLEERKNALGSFTDPRDLEGKIRLLQGAKQQLLDYVELINSSSGPLGRSVFDVLWARERYRQELRFSPNLVERVVVLNARKMLLSDLSLIVSALKSTGGISQALLLGARTYVPILGTVSTLSNSTTPVSSNFSPHSRNCARRQAYLMRRQRRLTQRLASKLSLSLAQSPVCSICARKFLRPTIALRTNFCAPSQMRATEPALYLSLAR